MTTIVDFLRKNKEYKEQFGNYEVLFKYSGHRIIIECECEEFTITYDDPYEVHSIILDIMEDFGGTEIRFCEECGKPFDKGFMVGDGSWYSCEDCFETAMDNTYGKGQWRSTDEEGYYGGYYESSHDGGEWEDTGVFYTEWN